MEKEELNLDQLEVGEWYELKGSADWLKWFSKHKGIHDGNCEISSEFIQQSCGLDFKKNAYTWCSGYTFRKATKEQLKSFLPKDHPDYPIENSDYKWMLMLEDDAGGNGLSKGEIIKIVAFKEHNKEFWYNATNCNTLDRIAEGKIKPFLTKEEAEKYWDKLNQSKPVKTPKTKQLSDLKKGDWVKFIFNENTSNFKKDNLYKLSRDWDNDAALIIDANGNRNGFGNRNLVNFTIPTQQEIETWEKSLIKDEPKEFVLPEKWCIKATEKNVHILKQTTHCNKHLNYNYTIGGYYGTGFGGDWQLPEGYTEITFEQFEKYILKSKVTVEDKPKEDMKTIPKYWYIENKYQEVRDYLVDTYNEFCIKSWNIYEYVGFDGTSAHKGCHGFSSLNHVENGATKITIEQFREYFLKKPKEVPQDDYSWWYELEARDVIESLINKYDLRKTGERFTVKKHESRGVVYYLENINSTIPEEWKLVSKAKDTKKNAIEEKLNLNEFPAQNLAQQQREILTFQKKCEVFHTFIPQPEETEIVPISKYFKIRN